MNSGTAAFQASLACTVLAAIFVLARLSVRYTSGSNGGIEDGLIAVSLLSSVALTICIDWQIRNGLGQHITELEHPERIPHMIKGLYVSIFAYGLGVCCIKTSIAILYLRFFPRGTYRKICWIVLVLNVTYGAVSLIVHGLSCLPVQYYWDRINYDGKCLNVQVAWFFHATWSILSDIVICVLPIPVVKGLQMPKRDTISLIVVFMLGGFACITSILRLNALYIATHFDDITWNNAGAAKWSAIEMNIGIICACMPSLRPILHNLYSRSSSSLQYARRKSMALTDNLRFKSFSRHTSKSTSVRRSAAGHDDSEEYQLRQGISESQLSNNDVPPREDDQSASLDRNDLEQGQIVSSTH